MSQAKRDDLIVQTRRAVSRRQMLRGVGAAAIGLPMLEAMGPSVGQRALGQQPIGQGMAGDGHPGSSPKRFVAMCATLGFHAPYLFPKQQGLDYELTPYLAPLAKHRDRLTVFSGLSHPEQQGNNGHASETTWLTSAPRPGLAGFRNTVSIDQLIASQIGIQTRFPYLALSTSGRSMSWTPNGVEIPAMTSPARLFRALFIQGTEKEVDAELGQLKRGKSILDTIFGRAKQLEQKLGKIDQGKIEEYLTAVRDLEKRMQQAEGWVKLPKPVVASEQPKDIIDKNDAIAKQRLLYDMIVMAIQSDSTRTITYQLSGMNSVPTIPGVRSDWHGLSHHGKDPAKIDELRIIEEAEFEAFGDFLDKLDSITENGQTLLDRTSLLFGSNLGNASAHDWHNLPVIVAGGGFKHSGFVKHDADNNTPLANLFVTLAQQMGVEINSFGSSTAASVRGLDT